MESIVGANAVVDVDAVAGVNAAGANAITGANITLTLTLVSNAIKANLLSKKF